MLSILQIALACTDSGGANDSGRTPSDAQFSYVSVGIHQSCGVANGSIGCWGPDRAEVETTATYFGDGHPPPGSNWRVVEMTSMSNDFGHRSRIGCALTDQGDPCCWGQYFDDDCETIPGPGLTLSNLAVGPAYACGTDEDHRLWCWGPNAPTGVQLSENVMDVTTRDWSVVALHSDGSLSSWAITDPDAGTTMGTQYYDRRTFSDAPLALQLPALALGCVFDVNSGDVLCDPYEPATPSEDDGLRSTLFYNVGGRTELVTGDRNMGICSMGLDGLVHCDAHFGSPAIPGVVAEDAVAFSAAAASVASGCAVKSTGQLTCWGAAEPPASLRFSEWR